MDFDTNLKKEIVPSDDKNFGTEPIEEKNLISHRSKAIQALKAKLAPYLTNPNIKESA